MRTEFLDGQLADLEMRFVAVTDDFLPPMPIIMLESSDPLLIQLGGIAAGMSGSPIFTEEGTWGAVGYGFAFQDSPPYYCFATPIEWIIGQRSPAPLAKPVATWRGREVIPLEIPFLVTGVNASMTEDRQRDFAPGRPLAVAVVLGDELAAAAVGTVSYLDGDRVYGFAHSMQGVGPVQLPIIESRTLGPVSGVESPFKYGTLNPTVRGTLTEDRRPAVRGVLDDGPELAPIQTTYMLPSGQVELSHFMARGIHQSELQSALVAPTIFRPLLGRVDNEPDHSLRVTTDIAFEGTDLVLSRSRLYANPTGRLHQLVNQAVEVLAEDLRPLMSREDYALEVKRAEVRLEVIPEPRYGKVTGILADSVAYPGLPLVVKAVLRVGRQRDREIELGLPLADTLAAGTYEIQFGSVAEFAQASEFSTESLFDFSAFDPSAEEETMEAAFTRLNQPDRNVLLQARLMSVPDDWSDPVVVAETEEYPVDLYLSGVVIQRIMVNNEQGDLTR